MATGSTDSSAALERGRAAFASRHWSEAFGQLVEADEMQVLGADDLALASDAAFLLGRDPDVVAFGTRAFRAHLDDERLQRAANDAFWLGLAHAQRGEMAQAGAWFERAGELVGRLGGDVPEAGYLLVPAGLGALEAGQPEAAHEAFARAEALGERFGDRDLRVLGTLGRGQSLIAQAEVAHGFRLLDEAMLAVTSDEATPIVAGIVYCATIEACHLALDLRRAQEWTDALTDWCAQQPDLVPYRGQCRLYRAELLRLHGDWPGADEESRQAATLLLGPPLDPGVGEAYYQQAELARLRGAVADAERAYLEASRYGRRPEPGIAWLRLAQGRVDTALGMIRRALEEAPADARLLEAGVEIELRAGDPRSARTLADRLLALATAPTSTALAAMAAYVDGLVDLVEGDATASLRRLREAASGWQQVGAPCEVARVRVAAAAACEALGDQETADRELEAARQTFEALGARSLLAGLGRASGSEDRHGLSAREAEVLGRLAAGLTNREIASELGISERTVDRHVSNLYTKLDVSSRAAATAWAVAHRLA
jgi:DNA-binding NarL/FixJ family response regulator